MSNQNYQRKGSYDNPYLQDEFLRLYSSSGWHGGWVEENSRTRYYVTIGGIAQEEDSAGNKRGTYENPYSEDVYFEMYDNYYWMGGYAIVSGLLNYYDKHDGTEPLSGSGSGCGSGSENGSGCGCGGGTSISQGQAWIPSSEISLPAGTYGSNDNWDVLIQWGNGNFASETQPPLAATLIVQRNFSEANNIPLISSWYEAYIVRIQDPHISTMYTFYIPDQYRS